MRLTSTRIKLALLPLAIAAISACNHSNSDDTAINYGALHNSRAITPESVDDAAKDRIMVQGNASAVIKALDVSSHVAEGGIDPTLYLIPNRSPTQAPTSQWRPDAIPSHTVTQQIGSEAKGFYALHGDTRNSDEVQSVAAPETYLSWIAEKNLFSYEGEYLTVTVMFMWCPSTRWRMFIWFPSTVTPVSVVGIYRASAWARVVHL